MSTHPGYTKRELAKIIIAAAEADSQDEESSRAYLESLGLRPDQLVAQGLKRIKQFEMGLRAKRTEAAQNAIEKFIDEASRRVDQLLKKPDYSFLDFIRKNSLAASFRNVESLSEENQREMLIRYFASELSKKDQNKHEP